jgi:hypothetical protein
MIGSFITYSFTKYNIRVFKSKRMRWMGYSTHERFEKCMQNFGRKPEGRRPLGRPSRVEDNIRMDLKEIWREYLDWMLLA